MVIRVPVRVGRVPEGVPRGLALVFATTAVLKLWRGGYLCFDPWAPANLAMTPVELLLAWWLWTERRREFGALLATATMLGAGALLTWAHLHGYDVAGCGCFGPVRLGFPWHLGVLAVLTLLSLATLLSEGPPPPPPAARPRLPGRRAPVPTPVRRGPGPEPHL